MYGRKYMGVARTTFIIDAKGRIARVFEKVKPEEHAVEVADAVAALNVRN
jgi:peroxiredoxin Q/BCP